MNICVLVPSGDHATQAGVRIRYRRIEQALRHQGHGLHVVPVQNLSAQTDFPHDVYIISKCYDARALLIAGLLQRREKLIGVDLFDDYFSQSHDSRFTGMRYWFRNLLQLVDFALCSTPLMCELAESFQLELAKHVLNDPAVLPDEENLRLVLRRKLEHVQRTGILNVGWFGIGDNPYFPVGLTDLVAFSGDLHKLRWCGFDIRLDILTNRRAMTTNGLAMLTRLAVPYAVEEWTEEREKRLLAKSLICFLPVNSQNFSVMKSLNRAESALCAGVQVLSSGYPVYEALGSLIYRDPAKLLDDIRQKKLALREDTVSDLMRLMRQCADPVIEARSLVGFLKEQHKHKLSVTSAAKEQPFVAIIHGRNTIGDVHKLAQRVGALSIGSPFSKLDLNFDVRFSFSPDSEGCDVLISERCCSMLGPTTQASLTAYGKVLSTTYQRIDARRVFPGLDWDGMALARLDSPMSVVASYPYVMASITQTLQHLFPGVCCYHAEHADLPWNIFPRSEARH